MGQPKLFPGEKVWVEKKGDARQKNKVSGRRKGVFRFSQPSFVGVWVQTPTRPAMGWVECFLNNDIKNGVVIISRRKEKQNELNCG